MEKFSLRSIQSKYKIINEETPIEAFKIRLMDCPWEGIVYSYTQIDCSASASEYNRCTFAYHIFDESENFDIDDFKTVTQLEEFEKLLGSILKDVMENILGEKLGETRISNFVGSNPQ